MRLGHDVHTCKIAHPPPPPVKVYKQKEKNSFSRILLRERVTPRLMPQGPLLIRSLPRPLHRMKMPLPKYLRNMTLLRSRTLRKLLHVHKPPQPHPNRQTNTHDKDNNNSSYKGPQLKYLIIIWKSILMFQLSLFMSHKQIKPPPIFPLHQLMHTPLTPPHQKLAHKVPQALYPLEDQEVAQKMISDSFIKTEVLLKRKK